MSRYLIVGASGFIGRAIIQNLDGQGLPVIALPRSNELDLCDPSNAHALSEYMDRAVVVHAAGIPRLISDEFSALQRNLQINNTLLKACSLRAPERIIFLSSVEVYGQPETLCVTENTEIAPVNNYGIGKAAAELMLKRWCLEHRLPMVCFRLPGVFGPNDHGRGFIGALAASIAANSRFRLTGQEVLNLVSGVSYTLNDIMVMMERLLGSFDIDDQSNEAPAQHIKFDNRKLRRLAPDYEFSEMAQALKNYARD